ncbi:hypothetical protein CPB83DRAFT_436253 [Crepidotus variabilis]|uniref:Uncharacterized protein n=1 Tax=Crepidotus variabilis TaxID=179855 RepID=A0A9P6JNB0_9AGAR|nr:hypothetical protein CPB83DRAFT_436253 [Crepidotus variabilis]
MVLPTLPFPYGTYGTTLTPFLCHFEEMVACNSRLHINSRIRILQHSGFLFIKCVKVGRITKKVRETKLFSGRLPPNVGAPQRSVKNFVYNLQIHKQVF